LSLKIGNILLSVDHGFASLSKESFKSASNLSVVEGRSGSAFFSFSDEYEINRTVIDMPSGYDAIDMELRDFDLVYGFPWPEEHAFFRTIMQQFGSRETLFLSYDAREEIEICRVSDL